MTQLITKTYGKIEVVEEPSWIFGLLLNDKRFIIVNVRHRKVLNFETKTEIVKTAINKNEILHAFDYESNK